MWAYLHINIKQMPKWVYTKRYITWDMDRKSKTNEDRQWITAAQVDIFLEAIENDYTIKEACAAAKFTDTTYYNYMHNNDEFRMRVEWARTKLLRDAKDKVHEWVLNDKDGEFSLKVLKARCPEQYNTQRVETKAEVKAEVEHKDVDAMLIDYYEE